jgi:hypothetical protein
VGRWHAAGYWLTGALIAGFIAWLLAGWLPAASYGSRFEAVLHRGKENPMPTVVHFEGAKVTLQDEFEKVNSQLHGSEGGLFVLENGSRVTIYKANIHYIEEPSGEQGPMVSV